MKIALDASDLSSGRMDGTTIYASEVVPRVARVLLKEGHTVDAYAPAEPRVAMPDGTRTIILSGKRFWTQTVLSRALFRKRYHCLFLPIQTLPLYRPKHLRVVAVVHDLDFWDYPEMFTFKNKLLLHWFTRTAVRNATRIVAVSEATKRDIMRRYGRDADDITMVHHGVNHDIFRPPFSDEEYKQETARVQSKYHIPRSAVMFVGALQPRKNVQGLIAAMEKIHAAGKREALVLVSGGGWMEDIIHGRIRRSSIRDRIHLLRNVAAEDLRALYWNAAVVALPSFSEGFGMPVLEAMACGTPVMIGDTAALREVVRDAAMAADPKKPDDIARILETILNDRTVRESLRNKGLQRAAQFSWEKTASRTASVIMDALETVSQ